MKRLTVTLILLATLVFVAAAAANTVTYSGQTWRVFHGTGRLGQKWSASHLTISGSTLREHVSGGVAAGVGQTHYQTFGTYQVRFRMSAARGQSKFCLLLFGKAPHDEIDFAEESRSDNGSRQQMTATLHYGKSNQMIHLRTHADMTHWHTVGVIWKKGSLRFLLDGKVWGTITRHVPTSPMHMTIQTVQFSGSAASDLLVSKVSITGSH